LAGGADKGLVIVEGDGELPRERYVRYRRMADRAHRAAAVAKTKEARDMYIAIAMTWDALATQMEDQAERLKLDETLQLWGPALPQRPTERK